MITTAPGMLFLMLAGHAYIDFGIQDARQSQAKRPDNVTGVPWPIGLGAHSFMHGGAVALITGIWWLGFAETVAHGFIDYHKSRGRINTASDQLCHALCKILWVIVAICC